MPRTTESTINAARSGLAIKKGIGLVNGIGTIDSDYRGEIKVILINWGEEDFVIDTEYVWNENDKVSVKIPPEKIKLSLKVVEKK